MVSLYFVAQGEVCPGISIVALQQRVPGMSHSCLRDSTHLFLGAEKLKVSSEILPAGQRLQSLACPRGVEVPHLTVPGTSRELNRFLL